MRNSRNDAATVIGLLLVLMTLLFMVAPLSSAQAKDGATLLVESSLDIADAETIEVDHPLWVFDHGSGTGQRVSDLKRLSDSRLDMSGWWWFGAPQPAGYSPRQVRHAYGFDRVWKDGAGQIIGIPNAFDYPNAAADLKKFINTFKLKKMYGLPGTAPCTVAAGPHPCFQVVYAQGVQPAFNEGWALESALDTQWAHAIAPGADILLVEASTNSFSNMFQAVQVATNMGATVVSMSWGAPQFAGQSNFDFVFNLPGVTFVAASGNSGNPGIYPAASPYVVAAGGTRLPLDRWGNRIGPETAWTGSGGGISPFTGEPGYQLDYPIPDTGGFRGIPDVAYNADPDTGLAVYDSHGIAGETGWFTLGGTSCGCPGWAGLTALANQFRCENLSSNDLVNRPQYDAAEGFLYRFNYRDITSGSNGPCGAVCTAGVGYDFVTGLGSPRAEFLVPYLASH